ncbi:autophagy protein 12 [Heterostelium album PN500]|uniref:Ubiquitin-like protein ATG12 n=1 Tax=Heterostelium pallidum (strain ATCC 26659 / Pp 5 / PN500) TaxID=670386 RepID=D3BFU3_HETP5|nr:autophagy protein 12 [Heterostelium album PN500]EFA79703.1 autophagy protein 12 [Heterostelium album PN500]|eukprot:XP_020431824.1 autophagy protein 12 [Heterostelium album PN500]
MSDTIEDDVAGDQSTPQSTGVPTSPTQSTSTTAVKDSVIIYFKNAGSAPALKQKKFKLQSTINFQAVIDNLRKQLKMKPNEPLFLFVNQVFQPSPDECLGELFKCFSYNDQLVINYSNAPAWG